MTNSSTVAPSKWKRLGYQFGMAVAMAIVSLIGHTAMVSRAAGTLDFAPAIAAIPGMIIIVAMVMVALILKMLIPLPMPAIAYCVLLAFLFTIPNFIPGSAFITDALNKVNFMALCTPVTACVGLSAAKDLPQLKKAGLPLLVVTAMTIVGSFLGSAIIADIVLHLTAAL